MKTYIALMIGLLIGGIWVQYRFTGNIWSNQPKEELCRVYQGDLNLDGKVDLVDMSRMLYILDGEK